MHRRRGRDTRKTETLLERDAERSLLEKCLESARNGQGSLVLIEGPAGKGKSSLLNLAGDLAREEEFRVLGAYGNDLERHFPFGVSIQLFEPWWRSNDREDRVRLVRFAPRAAIELLRHGPDSDDPDAGYAAVHGLFRLATMLTDEEGDGEPLAILVDDLHWCDGPSLRFLAYLAVRLADLPIAVICTTRPGEESTDPRADAALRAAAGEGLAQLQSLSDDAVSTIVLEHFPEADVAFAETCAEITGGNPFLLLELLEQTRLSHQTPDAITAQRLGGLAPDAVLDAVIARLGTMPPDVRAVAIAAAILGDAVPLRVTAELAGLDLARTAHAADALAEMQMLCPGEPLTFIHPLTRQSVLQSVAPLDRGQMHRRAALILDRDEAPADAIASHLLHAPAARDPQTVEVLHAAGRHSLASGAPGSAVDLLRRALAEGVVPTDPTLLADLAQAEAADERPEALDRLHQALGVVPRGARRAEVALTLGASLMRQARFGDAADILEGAAPDAQLGGIELAQAVFAGRVTATSRDASRAQEARALADQLLQHLPDRPSIPVLGAIAHVAASRAADRAPRTEVRHLADLAWFDGALLGDRTGGDASWPVAAVSLLMVDELERNLELCDIAESGVSVPTAIADHVRAWALYERGEITAAAHAARAAIDTPPLDASGYLPAAYVVIARCHLQRGELDEAENALALTSHPEMSSSTQRPSLLLSRSHLRLIQRRYDDALTDALAAGQAWEDARHSPPPAALAWRSTAALAHRARGEVDEAVELAAAELELARAAGVTRIISRALRVLGLTTGGAEGVMLLREAVEAGGPAPRLECIASLIAYGGALRRTKQRSAARAPLTEALALARAGGATALEAEAEAELAATGARVRNAARWGPEALTASERRVAELASQGLTTRQMAETLFVTTKTVEFHLRHIYQKLGVNSRDKLADALVPDS